MEAGRRDQVVILYLRSLLCHFQNFSAPDSRSGGPSTFVTCQAVHLPSWLPASQLGLWPDERASAKVPALNPVSTLPQWTQPFRNM